LAISQENAGKVEWKLFIFVVLCMVFARNAAMSFNRYADRHIDSQNPRTSGREIPSGVIKPQAVLLFLVINSILFIATTYFINELVFVLSPIALIVVLGYSYTKRFTALSHFILGLGLSLAPIGAYLSVTARFDLLPIVFSIIVLFWVSGFDIIYSLQDEIFDKEQRLHSIPARFGKKKALQFSSFLHTNCAVLILFAGIIAHFGIMYWIGSAVFVFLLLYQHLIIKPDDLSRVDAIFFTTNGIASLVFAFFVVIELL